MNKNVMVKMIRYDGLRPRQVLEGFPPAHGEDNALHTYILDENGFPVYTVSQKLAGICCIKRADRYRLYQSEPFTTKGMTAKGATVYPTVYSWQYTKSTVTNGFDPENKEQLYKDEITWEEGNKENPFSGPVIDEKPVHSQVPDLAAVAADEPPAQKTQFQVAAELKKKLSSLLPGGDEDATNHVRTLNAEIGKKGGGAYNKHVFVEFVKGMESLIEHYSIDLKEE